MTAVFNVRKFDLKKIVSSCECGNNLRTSVKFRIRSWLFFLHFWLSGLLRIGIFRTPLPVPSPDSGRRRFNIYHLRHDDDSFAAAAAWHLPRS